MRRMVRAVGLVVGLAFAAAGPGLAENVARSTVHFPKGATGTTLTGKVSGYDSVEYVLGAAAGQEMSVRMTTDNASAYFNVWAPGASEALFIGSEAGGDFSGVLAEGGDYVIQVYLMRNAARRNESAGFTLDVAITNPAAAPGQPQPDFADGLMGGPDFWEVTGVSEGDALNLRAEASTKAAVLARLQNGTILRNRGCKLNGTTRWCLVALAEDETQQGWVAGKYLREAAGPGAVAAPEGDLPPAGLPCSEGSDTFEQTCAYSVAAVDGGVAITVSRPGDGAGQTRVLSYRAKDQSFAGGVSDSLSWLPKGQDWLVSVNGTEFYLVPKALLAGG